MNNVFLDRSGIGPRHNRTVQRLADSAIPFAYEFLHIETLIDLTIVPSTLGSNLGGFFRFGRSRHGCSRALIGLNAAALNSGRVSFEKLLVTLFHEATHFWQFLRGDADCFPAMDSDARKYVSGDEDFDAYYAQPCEIEAREMADVMLYSYLRYRNNYRGQVPCKVDVNSFVWPRQN